MDFCRYRLWLYRGAPGALKIQDFLVNGAILYKVVIPGPPTYHGRTVTGRGLESETFDILVKALSRSDDMDLWYEFALRTIERLGPRARSATPRLLEFINTKTNVWVKRRAVLNILQRIDPDAAAGVSLR